MDLTQLVPEWIRTLEAYPPGMPIEELEREYGIYDSIKLASNENPLGPSPKALAAMMKALPQVHRYPDGGCYYLRRALAQRLGVVPEALIFGNGSNEIIELLVRTFLSRGDHAVMADQAFVIYRMVVQAAGGHSTLVPLRKFTHDLEAIADAITPATRMVFLANPNNPTGTIFFRAQWREFLAAVPPRVVIVLDEAYAEFVEDQDYPDSLADLGAERLLVVLRTFSKVYGLAALRIGFGVGPPELIELVDRVRQPFNVGTLAQVAALAALDDNEHVAATLRTNREGLAYLRAACERLGLSYVPSWANFLLIKVGNGAQVYERLLRAGVIVRPMGFYGLPEYVRVTVGLPAENERLVKALEKVLALGEASGAPF
ncbi:MAG: histidinol-phosphate transaminase [Deltaproteobacteria bacterium]|nr:histidinol-phosphate transaminase [Deltaproteobacteria bacterium]